jgi:hypothetical protein
VPVLRAWPERVAPVLRAWPERVAPVLRAWPERVAPVLRAQELRAWPERVAPVLRAWPERAERVLHALVPRDPERRLVRRRDLAPLPDGSSRVALQPCMDEAQPQPAGVHCSLERNTRDFAPRSARAALASMLVDSDARACMPLVEALDAS